LPRGLAANLALTCSVTPAATSTSRTPSPAVCPLELSAHDFKANVTEHQLNQGVTSENRAIETHRSVGREIRQVMTRDGVNPEDLPRAASIKRIVQKRQKAIKSGDA
jgi:ABC-type methionine transport system permease subunit